MRHQIGVQRLVTGYDASGDPVETWETKATVWAAVEPLRGDEYFTAITTHATISHRVTMRPYPGLRITPKDRLNFNGRLFDIKSVIDIEERGRELELMCLEQVG